MKESIESMSLKLNLTEQKVLTFLENHQEATTKEIAENITISEATVRRAFDRLAELSLIKRMHGGAKLQTSNVQIRNFSEKDKRNHAEKSAIAKAASSFIKRRDLVFLNSGSTTFQLLKYITAEKVHIVTNNIQLAMQNLKEDMTLTFLGGVYDATTRSSAGSVTLASLEPTFSSVTILGTNGLHPKHGLTSNSLSEVSVSQKMIQNTIGKVIILADHEKINRIANHKVCSLEDIDILITDKKTPKEYTQYYQEKGIEVIIAD